MAAFQINYSQLDELFIRKQNSAALAVFLSMVYFSSTISLFPVTCGAVASIGLM